MTLQKNVVSFIRFEYGPLSFAGNLGQLYGDGSFYDRNFSSFAHWAFVKSSLSLAFLKKAKSEYDPTSPDERSQEEIMSDLDQEVSRRREIAKLEKN